MSDNSNNKKGMFDLVGKLALGMVIGYLSGNTDARGKLFAKLRKGKDSISSSLNKGKKKDTSAPASTMSSGKASASDAEIL